MAIAGNAMDRKRFRPWMWDANLARRGRSDPDLFDGCSPAGPAD